MSAITGLPVPPKIIEFDDSSPFLSAFATSYATTLSTPQTSVVPLPNPDEKEAVPPAEPRSGGSESSASDDGKAEDHIDTESTVSISSLSDQQNEAQVEATAGAESEAKANDAAEPASEQDVAQTAKDTEEATSIIDDSTTDVDEDTVLLSTGADTEKGGQADPIEGEESDVGDASVALSEAEVEQETQSVASSEAEVEQETLSVGYADYNIGTSAISDSLKHIANAFDEKCREVDILRKMREKDAEEAAESLTLLEAVRVERDLLSVKVRKLEKEVVALKDEMSHKDQLLSMSDKISTSLFGVLMSAKSKLDEAEALAPAMRSISSSYASSIATCRDSENSESDDDDEEDENEDREEPSMSGNTLPTTDDEEVR